MGRHLYEALLERGRLHDDATEILGYNLAEVCASGPVEGFNATVVSHGDDE